MAITVVAGLGNPGPEYAGTRHNAGFRVVGELYRRHAHLPWRRDGACDVAPAAMASEVVLARPVGYMNRSGAALVPLLERLGRPPESLLVVVDDLDLPLGRLRLRRSGGPGTHNGLRDLVDHLGPGFPRLRVGIAAAADGEPPADLADWVLSPFDEDERERLEEAVARAADAVACAVEHGLADAMNRFNRPPSPLSPRDDGSSA